MKKKITAVIVVLLGISAAVGPRTIFPVCNGAMKMKCFDTAKAELFAGIAAAVVGLLVLFVKNRKIALALSLVAAALGAVILLIPTVIVGVCGSPMMHCVSVTKPALIVIGILEIIAGLLAAVFAATETEKEQK